MVHFDVPFCWCFGFHLFELLATPTPWTSAYQATQVEPREVRETFGDGSACGALAAGVAWLLFALFRCCNAWDGVLVVFLGSLYKVCCFSWNLQGGWVDHRYRSGSEKYLWQCRYFRSCQLSGSCCVSNPGCCTSHQQSQNKSTD